MASNTACTSINLIAGQHHTAGQVSVIREGDNLIITYTTNGDWTISETHLTLGNCENGVVPEYFTSNPMIGHFEHSGTHQNVNEVSYTVDITGIEDTYCFAAHAVVNGPTGGETAWAEGEDIGGNSWAMYVESNLSDCETIEDCVTCIDGIQNWDEEGIDCGGAFCEPCYACEVHVEYSNIVCDDNGTSTYEDDTFTVDITVTGSNTNNQWSGMLGGQTMYGNYGEAITYGPFPTNAGSNISGWFMDVSNSDCAMDIIITAPIGCTPEDALSCSSNNIVYDTYVQGLEHSNCIDVPSAATANSIMVEVWIDKAVCNSFPDEIEINGNIVPYSVLSVSAGEKLYRIELEGNVEQICVENIDNCTMNSMVIYVQRDGIDAASVLLTVDSEFFTAHNNWEDDCGTFELPLGPSQGNRNLYISVPIHEKDNRRTVRVTATAGNETDSETVSSNVYDEVGLINLSLQSVSPSARSISVEICSPAGDGDSFGVGVVAISTDCHQAARSILSDRYSSVVSESTPLEAVQISESTSIGSNTNAETGLHVQSNVSRSSFAGSTQVYPNPVKNMLTIEYHLTNDAQVQFQLTDINGRTIDSKNQSADRGENQIKLDVAPYEAGFYFVHIISGSERQTHKFVVIK